jgi:hypothetical protein
MQILKQFCNLIAVKRGTEYPTFKENVLHYVFQKKERSQKENK